MLARISTQLSTFAGSYALTFSPGVVGPGIDTNLWLGRLATMFNRVRILSARLTLRPINANNNGLYAAAVVPGVFDAASMERVIAQVGARTGSLATSTLTVRVPDAMLSPSQWYTTSDMPTVATFLYAGSLEPPPTTKVTILQMILDVSVQFDTPSV